ncbi:Glycosyltransferase, GT2 family [Bradyrhizobium shewense]|uniref:Glycosyltransferase, GT2 family n=1 Tax=Bradyrhizobium shewense TaxID=1761772 RepID=A0A1C3WRA4_9BRAD|nr:glycosyltransferase [Bradyrhizobium shewense]SCB42592.1 Glycosyltransferase, GT2 family [Bradyrhizobium shewense]
MKYVLTVVVGTYNRLDQLKRCIESIVANTTTHTRVYVTDAGSTDGTIEYLSSIASESITPIFVGKKLGQARAYNEVFKHVDSPFVCWLSDDNEVVNNGLDRAVNILENDRTIGMVALKTKDVQGPFADAPFIGGLSPAGILNVNQGVLPTGLLQEIGGFSEEFRDYGIDNALTAEVLFKGYKVVYTRAIALHHYRNWSEDPTSENYQWLQQRHAVAKALYEKRYCSSAMLKVDRKYTIKRAVAGLVRRTARKIFSTRALQRSATFRTISIVLSARFVSWLDLFSNKGKGYHLVQRIR